MHARTGHWWECFGYGQPSEHAPLPKRCLDYHIQVGQLHTTNIGVNNNGIPLRVGTGILKMRVSGV